MNPNDQPTDFKINKRDLQLNPTEGLVLSEALSKVLNKYNDKRVLVVGPPCSGKSTLLQHIENGVDMDIVFDTMPEDFKRHVLHHEYPFMFVDGDRETVKYTEKPFDSDKLDHQEYLASTTQLLQDYISSNLTIIPGHPVFGTSVIDADVIIHMVLSDEALDARLETRNRKTHRTLQRDRVYAIKKLIEQDIFEAQNKGVIVEEFHVDK